MRLRRDAVFGTMFGVEAKDMTVCDIELLNGRARQKAASSVAHKLAPPPSEIARRACRRGYVRSERDFGARSSRPRRPFLFQSQTERIK